MANRDEKGMFGESLSAATKDNYLGDPEVLDSLLEFWSAEFVERLQDGATASAIASTISSRLGRILLGKNEEYSPVRKWNAPGGIDVFCKDLFKLRDKTSAGVMYHTVLTFFDALCNLIVEAGSPEFLEETWQTKRKQLITKYSYIFRGVSPDQVAIYLMEEQNEQRQSRQVNPL
jgi:hypothetical protein